MCFNQSLPHALAANYAFVLHSDTIAIPQFIFVCLRVCALVCFIIQLSTIVVQLDPASMLTFSFCQWKCIGFLCVKMLQYLP